MHTHQPLPCLWVFLPRTRDQCAEFVLSLIVVVCDMLPRRLDSICDDRCLGAQRPDFNFAQSVPSPWYEGLGLHDVLNTRLRLR